MTCCMPITCQAVGSKGFAGATFILHQHAYKVCFFYRVRYRPNALCRRRIFREEHNKCYIDLIKIMCFAVLTRH